MILETERQGRGPGPPEETLLESREAAGLADEHISNLAHLDADEEDGVAGVLLIEALPERLWTGEGRRSSLRPGRVSVQSVGQAPAS